MTNINRVESLHKCNVYLINNIVLIIFIYLPIKNIILFFKKGINVVLIQLFKKCEN